MAKQVISLNQEQLTEVLKTITIQNLPRWLKELQLNEHPTDASVTPKMSYEEFLVWADEDTLAEWENGEVIMSSPASLKHQDLAGFLATIMRLFAEHYELGIVVTAPFQMKLENGREPDVLYIANAHLDRVKETYLDGPADLAIEIISPESINRDRGAKFVEYETGAVLEYWLIDPMRQQAEFYQLGEQGQYHIVFSGATGTYHSFALQGFWLRVEWFWQKPLPDVARTAWEIIGLDGLRQLLTDLEQQKS